MHSADSRLLRQILESLIIIFEVRINTVLDRGRDHGQLGLDSHFY